MSNNKSNSKNSNTQRKDPITAAEAGNKQTPKANHYKNRSAGKSGAKKQQPQKDSSSARVNYDNARVSKFEKDIKKHPGYNDIRWYAKNPELMRSAASIPFASILGNKVFSSTSSTFRLPGLMVLPWYPAIGVGSTSSEVPYAVNQAGKSQYSFLVHANSRNYKYEYQDLMLLELAAAQVFSIISAMTRAYGIAKTYIEQSRYYPAGILGGMGFEPSNIRASLGQMWFDLNELIARTAQIWIPNTLPVIERWFWLNQNIFTDDQDPKAQMYMFVQARYFMYDETSSDTGGSLVPVYLKRTTDSKYYEFDPSSNVYQWNEWMDAANMMVNALINSEDRGMIMGDILNAYGANAIYALPAIPSDYRVAPVYNQEVLTQIENATSSVAHMNAITQTSAGLVANWKGDQYNASAGVGEVVVNFHHPQQPTPEEIVIATRFVTEGSAYLNAPVAEVDAATNKITFSTEAMWLPRSVGSETMGTPKIWIISTPNFDGDLAAFTIKSIGTRQTNIGGVQSALPEIASFDWHPFIYHVQAAPTTGLGTGISTANVTLGAYGDYSNYSVISNLVVRKLNDMALFSEFGVPQM